MKTRYNFYIVIEIGNVLEQYEEYTCGSSPVRDQAFRNDCFTFTSKPIDKTSPSFSMKIRLDEIPIHKLSISSFQLSFNYKFICFSLGLVKESTQFGILQCALPSF